MHFVKSLLQMGITDHELFFAIRLCNIGVNNACPYGIVGLDFHLQSQNHPPITF
jgi:hypothetical protein